MKITTTKLLVFGLLFSISTISFGQTTSTTNTSTDTTTTVNTTVPADTTTTVNTTAPADTTTTANTASPVKTNTLEGLWRTYDNNDQARSIVQFFKQGGTYNAKVVKIIPVADKDDKICTQCSGDQKNKPLVGMTIVTGLVPKGKNQWDNGTVLDTDSGKSYDCSATLSDDGRTLHLYAHLGPFGATVDWKRVDKVE